MVEIQTDFEEEVLGGVESLLPRSSKTNGIHHHPTFCVDGMSEEEEGGVDGMSEEEEGVNASVVVVVEHEISEAGGLFLGQTEGMPTFPSSINNSSLFTNQGSIAIIMGIVSTLKGYDVEKKKPFVKQFLGPETQQ